MTFGKLTDARRLFHSKLYLSGVLSLDAAGTPSNADKSSTRSKLIARGIIEKLGNQINGEKLAGQTAGASFESICAEFIDTSFRQLNHMRPGSWVISQGKLAITKFDQYSHLAELAELAGNNIQLAAALGSDYLIKPDITVGRHSEPDSHFNPPDQDLTFLDDLTARLTPLRKMNNDANLILHASISCKWTLRSDRGQNARSEGLNLVRNRKGRLPHIAVIVGEPMPSRIASIALGTGDIDCVYHFALNELIETVRSLELEDAYEILNTMICGKRLRDIADLPIDLII